MNAVKKIEKVVNKFFTLFMTFSLSAMVILVFINAVMRYVFKSSIPVSEEYARFFFMWTTFFGVIAAFKDKNHVRVTIVVDLLKGWAQKTIGIVAHLVTLAALAFVLYGGVEYVKSTSSYKTVSTGINFGIVSSGLVVMTVGAMVLVVKALVDDLRGGK